MATIDDQVTSTISSQALAMLRCFVSGMDNVVYEIARDIAERRAGNLQHGPTDIEAQDVMQAAECLAQRIKTLVADGTIPADMDGQVDRMVNCCRKQVAGGP